MGTYVMTAPDREGAAIDEIAKKLERDPTFSDEEMVIIRAMIQTYRGLAAMGKISKFAVFGLAALAGAIAAWDVIISKIRAWLIGS